MAKIIIELPDELVGWLTDESDRLGEARSSFVRRYLWDLYSAANQARQARVEIEAKIIEFKNAHTANNR